MHNSVSAIEIIESIPKRFRAEKAVNFNAIIHLNLSGEFALLYTVAIENQTCDLQKGLHGKANCIVTSSIENYEALETGQLNPQEALLTGKVQVSDIAVMIQFVKCFKRYEAQQESEQNLFENIQQRIELEGPLKGVRIVDFTRLLPGPLATMFLAQQGAEVIKIEDPENPDYIRDFEPKVGNSSAFYLSLNANKKSFSINYLSEKGRQILLELIKTADVLVEQFRPSVMQKFGLDFETLKGINPKLIYVSITGYGSQSSLQNAAGHDLNFIAESGLPYISGSKPTLLGFQAADVAGGSYMAMNAITTALFQREKTGKGMFVNVSMSDSALPLMALPLALQQFKSENISAQNFELAGAVANYNIYECSDGNFVALAALEPKFWNNFCIAISKPEWKEKILSSGEKMNELKKELEQLFLSKTKAEWLNILVKADCCFSAVNSPKEVLESPYFKEQSMFIETEFSANNKLKILRHPLVFEQTDFSKKWNAPNLGEDSIALLQSLRVEKKEIQDLVTQGIVKQSQSNS